MSQVPYTSLVSDSTAALSVALQQPVLAADQQNICRILQVCKAWRTAVQQSSACITDVEFSRELPSGTVAQPKASADVMADVTQFADWVSLHAGTIRSITIGLYGYPCSSKTVFSLRVMAHSTLACGLRAAAAVQPWRSLDAAGMTQISYSHASHTEQPASNAASIVDGIYSEATETTRPVACIREAPSRILAGHMAAPSAAVTAAERECTATAAPYHPLLLQSFTYRGGLDSPLLLTALPTAALTHLELTGPSTDEVAQAVSIFSSLRSLHIDSGSRECIPDGYLSSVNKLRELTSLYVCPLQHNICSKLALLPTQLIKLDLNIGGYSHGIEMLVKPVQQILDIHHLAHLQQLVVNCFGSIEATIMPQQLQQLDVTCFSPVIAAFCVTTLQQLQQLTVRNSRDAPEDLLSLHHMECLQDIDLHYEYSSHAVVAAPVWCQLDKLTGLTLQLSCSMTDMATIVDALTQLTSLTKLDFLCELQDVNEQMQDAEAEDQHAAVDRISGICLLIGQLTTLKQLHLVLTYWAGLEQDAVLHLSTLTNLTCLRLSLGQESTTAAIIAVLLNLTRLQDLALCDLQLQGGTCLLPVIGKLQDLTCLSMNSSEPWVPGELQHGLKYLTRLRGLREIHGFESCGEDALKQFWAVLRR